MKKIFCYVLSLIFIGVVSAQSTNSYKLVWGDEFNIDGKIDSTKWRFENGFVRNQEPQWYQPNNAYCQDGMLRIEARKEKVKNTNYEANSNDWRKKK